MRIHVLQHVPFEGPAAIGEWAERNGHPITKTQLYETTKVPAQSDFDWLVVMGGPMGVYDQAEHPWLEPEKAFIAETIAAGKRVVGVCLGSQLIAEVLGGRVYRNPRKEIGWLPITLTDAGRASSVTGVLPETLDVFHWHGDTFELPEGAVHLARSAACEHQIFLYDNRVLALQCHLESTPESVRDIVEMCADEIVPSASIQSAERMLAASDADFARMHEQLFGLLDRFAAAA
ncbi:type 1 glutamine amidotransferase [Thiorhodococcus mannitoliphagus]|uniref:Type 1 glutamine amidotransferase n=1 Tax=Thiorhodococcus mannitoliphagus TaxID=329406 RepID=A0A6P1DYJ6_9GAMM|nr:type 1 glutamine amidotransferase [Thiorhodococcus mannitoliphagus]NEX21232.1 type 1 glutamine amidotransferase [Thiorhodococcus mannitoliphagus]